MPNDSAWRVLLVDDEPDSLKLAHDILKMMGAEVACASNGQEFQTMWGLTTPELVIVDLAMPKPDGWQILAHIRAHASPDQVRVIAMTAYYSEGVMLEARRAGFDAFINKPLRSADLIAVVKQVMGAV